MAYRPLPRIALCQTVAFLGFVVFLVLMAGARPARAPAEPSADGATSAAVFLSRTGDDAEPPEDAPDERQHPEPEQKQPRRPERFQPSASPVEDASTRTELPPAAAGRPKDAERVPVPPRDLPLSYLMKFQNLRDFHAFLEALPDPPDDAPAMSLIRIEGLPRSIGLMRRLFESYRMEPFLFNPDRFSYVITGDRRLLRDPAAVRSYVASVGRYLREAEPNAAYAAIRDECIRRARADPAIRRAITSPAEFDRMVLGLASMHLARFFRRLERDTAQQLGELTGKPVAVADIARIDCRFRSVNGVMVLVPWRAYLGTGADRAPLRIWKEE